MTNLLGVKGLPAAEVSLLRTIVRLSSDLPGSWSVVEDGLCDVLLSDASVQAAGAMSGPHTRVIQVARRGTPVSGPVMFRPIYSEELVGLLKDLMPGLRPAVAQSTGTDQAPADRPTRGTSGAVRLKRWPSGDFFRSDRRAIRMASALAARPHTAASLSDSTGEPVALCQRLIERLEREGFLAEAAFTKPRATVSARPGAATDRPHSRSLLDSIRRKLGWGIARTA